MIASEKLEIVPQVSSHIYDLFSDLHIRNFVYSLFVCDFWNKIIMAKLPMLGSKKTPKKRNSLYHNLYKIWKSGY